MTKHVDDKTLIYNALDCVVTWQCADEFFKEVDGQGYRETYDHTIDLYDPLMYMMIRGMLVDTEELNNVKHQLDNRLGTLEGEITTRCGRWVNPMSPKDCKTYFYIEKGIPEYTKYNRSTGKSSITCDDKALQRIARGTATRKGLFEAKLIQEYRRIKKLKGTYIEMQLDSDSRIRCSYNPRGTKFGRLSSSKTLFGTGMNMQNLPPVFLSFIVADPGMIFVQLDKRQAEWVVMAYICGDASMIKAAEEGLDVHAYTASEMFKVPIDIILSEQKVLEHESDPAIISYKRDKMPWLKPYLSNWLPRTMSMRQCGKKSNHGLNFGETYKMFSLINEITEKEARVIVDFYHRIYPGLRRWYGRIQSQLGEDRTLNNLFGRKCRFLDRWGDDLFKAAYSYIPQSTVAELINRGIVSIYRDKANSLADFEILRQVHDSIDLQASDKNPKILAEGAIACRSYINPTLSSGGREFTINTDLKIGYSLGTMKEIPFSDNINELSDAIRDTMHELKTGN